MILADSMVGGYWVSSIVAVSSLAAYGLGFRSERRVAHTRSASSGAFMRGFIRAHRMGRMGMPVPGLTRATHDRMTRSTESSLRLPQPSTREVF